MQAVALWNELLGVLDGHTGEVLATRAELAELVGCEPRDISRLMGELERLGAIIRKRDGRAVKYFLSPLVGTTLSGAARDKAQASAPPLRLVP